MSSDIKQSEDLPIETYQELMSGIEFMQSFMEEPDVFKEDSDCLKSFLIQSFCFLHPDFHYLSFVTGEGVEAEIIKVSQILQILPATVKKNDKLFSNMTKEDINKFWLKFFNLFTRQDEFNIHSIFNISLENEIDFFKDITSTFNYINYKIPVLLSNKLDDVDMNCEIDSWKQTVNTLNHPPEIIFFNANEEQTTDIDIEKLTIDFKHIASMYSNTKKLTNQQNNNGYVEFFISFINFTGNVLQYKNSISVISSPILDEINFKMLSCDKDLLGSLYYIKRCNNFVRTLRSRMKSYNGQ